MKELSKNQRLKRAGKKFALFFALALFSVFIPIAHFFLVPAFLISAFAMPYFEYQKRYFAQAENCPCIHCKKTFAMKCTAAHSSVQVYCTHCGAQNSVDLKTLIL